ncbi:MAG TPA: IS1595 family transposase [Candidatus Sulfotelmatobacter sp.]|nr:IS1595 family transposase [Candidatus Sulfotelmatobacter sp.]
MENGELNLVSLAQHFSNEDAAREFMEKLRWPDGPVCPHCGEINNAYRLEPKPSKKGTHVRKGVWKCAGCREQFTVTVGTIFEDSHIPLNKWLLAYHLLCASKKGMSAHQLHRMLKVTYRSAWFMAHRIRYTMSQEPLSSKLGGVVEIDETYVGGKRRKHVQLAVKPGQRAQDYPAPFVGKAPVVAVLQRQGRVQSMHLQKVTAENLRPIVDQMVAEDAHVMTDTSSVLAGALKTRKHDQVNHSVSEYVRYEDGVCISTNTIEGYFSILKRGINGVYHQVGKRHLHRYLAEFDFRYNTRREKDGDRTLLALKSSDGKRLMLRDSQTN